MRLRWLIVLLLLSSTLAYAEPAVKPFIAHYQVFAKGLQVGKGQISLRYDDNGHYFMRSEVKPSGLAALILPGPLSEEARGHLGPNGPQPRHYLQQQRGNKKRTIELDFDWSTGQVLALYKTKQYQLALPPRAVDPLSLHLLAMWDLQRGHHPSEYILVTKNQVKAYQVEQRVEDIVETPLGNLASLRVSRRRSGSSRATTVWFAPSLDYLPIQIAQHKDGKEQLRLRLEAVQR